MLCRTENIRRRMRPPPPAVMEIKKIWKPKIILPVVDPYVEYLIK